MVAPRKGQFAAMTDTNPPRPRGPWDPRPDEPKAVETPAPAPRGAVEAPLDKGQHPAWALISTLLLGGFIWAVTGNWVIALAAIFGLFVHEYGHVLAMNAVGMGPARIYIIPFLGGLAKGQRMPTSEWHGVLVSLAGPAFGLFAAIPFFALYLATGAGEWLLATTVIALINLINLAPAPPLDGSKAIGPVLARIHPMLERVAMIAMAGLVIYWGFTSGRLILGIFLCIALIGYLRRGAWRPEGRPLTAKEAVMSVALFVATALACAAVGIAALMPMAEGSLADAARVAGVELGLIR